MEHDILNIASIVPGPVGAIAGVTNAMVYLLMGDTANANKCIIQAALTGIALPAGGLAIGSLCNISGTARIITALTLVGAGMYTVGTSFVDFCSYFEKLSNELQLYQLQNIMKDKCQENGYLVRNQVTTDLKMQLKKYKFSYKELINAFNRNEVKLILSKVDESGKVTLYELDTTGKILGEWP